MLCYSTSVFNGNRIKPNLIQPARKLINFLIYTFLYMIINDEKINDF